jgi:hypothetical protein
MGNLYSRHKGPKYKLKGLEDDLLSDDGARGYIEVLDEPLMVGYPLGF